MLVNSVKPLDEIRGGNMLALPEQFTIAPWLSAWSTAQIGVQPTRPQAVFLELDQDGGAGGDLDPARRAQRLRADQVALCRPQPRVRRRCCSPASSRFQIVLIPMAQSRPDRARRHLGPGAGARGLRPRASPLFFRNYYEAFPSELIKAAQIDGAGFFRIFQRILLPTPGRSSWSP